MLFMAVQTHKPKHCPLNDKKPKPLWDTKSKKVKLINIYACPPEHVLYFVLEANNFEDIQSFFMPGMTKTTVDIKPVSTMK